MEAVVCKDFRFEAAHQLLNHDGKCQTLHGHSYRMQVRVQGTIRSQRGHPKDGMVIDFADIKRIWKTYIEPVVDHQNLNESLGGIVTTAENIAVWMLQVFRQQDLPVSSVTIWETETSSATVLYSEVWANGG